MDAKQLREAFREKGITKVKVGGFDIDGVLRGKFVALEKCWSMIDSGFGFCDVIFGWDMADVLYDNANVTGWHTGYPDIHATIDLSTFRVIPWEPGTAAFLVDFVTKDGKPHPACPRSLLKAMVGKANAAGYRPLFGAEFEFFMFRETPQSLAQKRFRDLESLTPGMFGYSWGRECQNSELCHANLDEMCAFVIPIESLHTEARPGVTGDATRSAAEFDAVFDTSSSLPIRPFRASAPTETEYDPTVPDVRLIAMLQLPLAAMYMPEAVIDPEAELIVAF